MGYYKTVKSSPRQDLNAIQKNSHKKAPKKTLRHGISIQKNPHTKHHEGIKTPAMQPKEVKTYASYASVVTTPPPAKPLVNTNYKTERKQYSANNTNKHQKCTNPANPLMNFTNQINQLCLTLKNQEKKNKDPVQWYLEVVNSINTLKSTTGESIVQRDKHYQSCLSPFYCRALDSLVNTVLQHFDKAGTCPLNTHHILETVCTVSNPIHLHPDIYRPESAIHAKLKQLFKRIIDSELDYLRYRASYPDSRDTKPVREKIKWLLNPEAPVVLCGFLTREQVNAYSEQIEHPEPYEAPSDTLPLRRALASNNLQAAENLIWQSVIPFEIRMIGDILKCSLTDLVASFQATHNSSQEFNLLTALAEFYQKHHRTIKIYDSLKKSFLKIELEANQRLLRPAKVNKLIKRAFKAIDKNNPTITNHQTAARILKPIIPYERTIKKLPDGDNLIKSLHSIKGIIIMKLFDKISQKVFKEVGHKEFNYSHLASIMKKYKQQCIENEKYKFLLWERHLDSWHMTVSKVWGETILDLLKSDTICDDNIHDLLQLKAITQDNLCPTTRQNLKKLLIRIFDKNLPSPISVTPGLTELIDWGSMILRKTPKNHKNHIEERLNDNKLSQQMEQLRALISTHKNEEEFQLLNMIYAPPEQFRDNPNTEIPKEQPSSAELTGSVITTTNPTGTQQLIHWSQQQFLLTINTVTPLPPLPQAQTANSETQTENSKKAARGVQTENPEQNSKGTQTGKPKNTSTGTQANLNKKPETTGKKTQTDLGKTPGTTSKKTQTDHDNIPATPHWEHKPGLAALPELVEYQVTETDPVLKESKNTPQKPLLLKPGKTEQNIPTQAATDEVTIRETDSKELIVACQSLSGDSTPVTREKKGLPFNKSKLKKSVKKFRNAGLEISVDQLCGLLESNHNFCKKWSQQKPLNIGYIRQCFEKWQQPEQPSISTSSTPGQSPLPVNPSTPEPPPLPPSTPVTAVPKPPIAEQPDEILIPIFQNIQAIKANPGMEYKHPLPITICTNGARAALISEIEALLVPAEQVDAASNENDNNQKDEQFIDNELNLLTYRLGKTSWKDATDKIKKENPPEEASELILRLQTIKPMHHTKLTDDELAELKLYSAAIQVFHKNQISGTASCQSFANAIECFLRNQGYSQVIGIDEQLDMNVAPGAPTAVACWNVAELRSACFTSFLHNIDSDAFRKAIQSGEQAGASPKHDSIYQLNGERYLLLRTTPTGEEGHFVNLVRSKASGRFIVIDGQKQNIYPVIHPQPDFTITDDADKDITQRNIYTFRTDLIPDSTFSEELQRSNALMQSSITAQKASLSTG